ncbi:GNAT family N-acetyltransferase [Devosia sp. XJ19-1]|uniref:GNAT family N-acetyltransferase n=1 Tax=Devosia ureilytica TaxID=2952754 RepID=A0A9Q4ALS7_9HYPH|nr:GNAT family N-acetyltransferase [Devosia ureilytica]MCP8882168.1 GNAT family N-acetyltransferase [Devosia ureilytica]MCP8885946.1 GNAT family N-acetyltransferase [Devosia ureilytica]
MTSIPTLETERLILRAPTVDDYPAYAAFMASDRSRMMGGPHVRWAAWGMFSSDVAMWALYGHGALMIDLKGERTCVGQVGINHGPMFPEKELGWMLYDGFEGFGYATEAGAALKAWAFVTLGLETLVSYFDPDNVRSMAVSARLGGVRDDTAQPQDEGDVVFRYNRPY